MNEKILGYLTEYFQMNDFFKKFYEIVFTDERILIINTGETFRSWIARADVAYSKREELLKMNLVDIYKKFEDKAIESIYYEDIKEINLTKKTFIKNGKIDIGLNKYSKKYYTTKQSSIEDFKKIFVGYNMPINIEIK